MATDKTAGSGESEIPDKSGKPPSKVRKAQSKTPQNKALRKKDRPFQLSWLEEDIENRIGFRGGRFTSANKGLCFILALILTTGFFLLLVYGVASVDKLKPFSDAFLRPGNAWTLGPAMLLFFLALTILFFKNRKLTFQRQALHLATVPQNPEFVLNEQSARSVLERLRKLVDNPRHFVLLNRIEPALASLHNIGGLSEVSAIMKSQAENDENQVASSYTLIGGTVWAVPVLGFIGTVQGLSTAIGNFARTLQLSTNIESIKSNLQDVTGGLATAFETTLVALICALIIQLILNFMQQQESDFLDECNDYCHTHVISKLRLVAPVEEPANAAGVEKQKPEPPMNPGNREANLQDSQPEKS